jgi:hypothetical protein
MSTATDSFKIVDMLDDREDELTKVFFSSDSVNSPPHYNSGTIECIDYIKQVLGLDGFASYCHGNLIKYQHRHRYKNKPIEDLEKAKWYLERMIETLKEKERK